MTNLYVAFRRDNALELQRNGRHRDVPTSLQIQESNPIYEGAIYETTPGEPVKSLVDSTSCPNTPSSELNFRYTLHLAPRLPAPRKVLRKDSCESSQDLPTAKLEPAELSSEHGSLSTDEYMAMTTVMLNKATNNDEIHG